MHLENKNKTLFILCFARFSLSLQSVTTNQGCIGYQSSMNCIARNRMHAPLCSQGWGDPEELIMVGLYVTDDDVRYS